MRYIQAERCSSALLSDRRCSVVDILTSSGTKVSNREETKKSRATTCCTHAGTRHMTQHHSADLLRFMVDLSTPRLEAERHLISSGAGRHKQSYFPFLSIMSDLKKGLEPAEPPPAYEVSPKPTLSPRPSRRGQLPPPPPLELPALSLLRDKRVILASASPRRKHTTSLDRFDKYRDHTF